ncbi:MAG: alpha-L-rhamnosidase, partial [Chitinophagaceae bacterium]
FDMNNRSDVPGYGWQIAHGATALTESWQAYGFVSNNHFMLGHLMEWFYSGLAGIRQGENGVAFKEIEIRPAPAGDVTHAGADYRSPYGLIKSYWKLNGQSTEMNVQIPVNTSATIYIPNPEKKMITEGGTSIEQHSEIRFFKYENGHSVYKIGSGSYSFSTN